MISRLLSPWAVRLATYARVRGSVRIRVRATVCRAELACRSAAAVEAMAVVLPEDAARGLTPQSAATLGLAMHSVFVAARSDQQRGGDIGANTELCEQERRRVVCDGGDRAVEFGDLRGEMLPSTCY